MVLISIVTINRNNLNGLIRTVESVLMQSHQEFKWYIIDGMSTDGSIDYINNINFKNLTTLIEADNGIYHAMNKGINLVDSDSLVLFLNSGDCLYADNILFEISKINNCPDIIYGDYSIKMVNNKLKRIYQPEFLNIIWLFNKTINHQSYLIKGSLLKKFNFDCLYKVCADWAQLMKILINEGNINILRIPLVISIYEIGGFSDKNNELRINERRKFLKINLSSSLYDSFENIGGLVTKPNFNNLLKLSKSKWRWKIINSMIKLIS